jgi:hypothetical protein
MVLSWCKTWSHTLRREYKLRGFEERKLKRIFGSNGRREYLWSEIICTPPKILLE